jgi:hypothetical protein
VIAQRAPLWIAPSLKDVLNIVTAADNAVRATL